MLAGKLQLAEDLDALEKSRPLIRSDLTGWYERARLVHDRIRADAYGMEVPHFVLHFLIDADTRVKDRTYAAEQERLIQEYVRELRSQQ